MSSQQNGFQAMSEQQLLNVEGGNNFFYRIGEFITNVYEGVIKGMEEVVDTSYNAGYRLGSYIESKLN